MAGVPMATLDVNIRVPVVNRQLGWNHTVMQRNGGTQVQYSTAAAAS